VCTIWFYHAWLQLSHSKHSAWNPHRSSAAQLVQFVCRSCSLMLSTSLVFQICFMTMSAKKAVKFLHQTSLLKFAYKLYSSVLCCLTCCRPLEEESHWRCPQAAEMGLCCQPQICQPSCLAPILTWSHSNPNSLEYVFFLDQMVVLSGKYYPRLPNTSQCNNLQLVVICDRVKWTHTQLMAPNCTIYKLMCSHLIYAIGCSLLQVCPTGLALPVVVHLWAVSPRLQ